MPWYTTEDAKRDANKQRQMSECDVHTGCWKCGIGRFHLMRGSDYLWQCDNCWYIGQLKVTPKSLPRRSVLRFALMVRNAQLPQMGSAMLN